MTGTAESIDEPSPPTCHLLMDSGLKSGSHTTSMKSGGFPEISFNPSVIKKALARESPKPIHAIFHSYIFLRQMSAFGVDRCAVGPGIRRSEMAGNEAKFLQTCFDLSF